MRLLELLSDPRALSVLATYDLARNSDLDEAVEAMASHALAPSGWADRVSPSALPIVLRNPGAIVTAERLLRDALTAAVSRAVECESCFTEELRDGYGGVLTYEDSRSAIANLHDGYNAVRRVPGGHWLHEDGWTWETLGERRLPKDFAQDERFYSWPAALAYTAHLGTEWQRAVYETGLAPVCLRRWDHETLVYRERWYLVVRDGDGWKLPELLP